MVCREGKEKPLSWITQYAAGGRSRSVRSFAVVAASTDSTPAAPTRTRGRHERVRRPNTTATSTDTAIKGTSAAYVTAVITVLSSPSRCSTASASSGRSISHA
ncbi:hypothetical protein ADK43_32130 [Streptomyces rimosus subsp. rimosus]|nr:hypothetical protein ADK43_32130 [Streptomyces rimosus subsp. rimosus]